MMKVSLAVLLAFFVGSYVGYFGLPLLHARNAIPVNAEQRISDAIGNAIVTCDFSAQQIDRLSARITPSLIDHLATTFPSNVNSDPKVAAQQHQVVEKTKTEQTAAFTGATQVVDQMIANRQVTPQGLKEAHRLLQQSGQADRMVEIGGHIAVAVSKGELTPQQAGLLPPGFE